MKGLISRLAKKTFLRNVLILSSGTIIGQILALISTPLITRIYGPISYGLMGTFNAIIATIIPIAAFTYPIAIVIQKEDKDAKQVASLSLLLALMFSLISLLVLLLFNNKLIEAFDLNEIGVFLYFIPLVILFAAFSQVLQQWLLRKQEFNVSAKVAFTESLIQNGTKVGLGLVFPGAFILLLLSALGQGIRGFLIFNFLRRSKIKLPLCFRSINEIKRLAIKNKDFPLFRAPQVFINAFSDNLPVVLLSTLFGPLAVGFYTLGRSILTIPSNLIGNAIGDVFYPRITEAAYKKEDISKLIIKATLSLGAVAIIPFSIVSFFGPFLFELIFGADWGIAGEYARWISIFIFTKFIYQPCIKVFPVISAQAFHLKFTLLSLIINALALIIGYYLFNDDIAAIIIYSITGSILNILLIILTIKYVNDFIRKR